MFAMLRLPRLLALYTSIAFSTCSVVQGQWTFSEMMNRNHQEKAKVVSARLVVDLIPRAGELFERITWYREFQPVGNHDVLLSIYWGPQNKIKEWTVQGRSEDMLVTGGQSNRGISRTAIPQDFSASGFAKGDVQFVGSYIDWRQIGLGFCGDRGRPFDAIANSIAGWDEFMKKTAPGDPGTRITQDRKSVTAVFGGDVYILIDADEGFRIREFRRGKALADGESPPEAWSQWKVSYEKSFDLVLPVQAELVCGNRGSATYKIEWISVNEPLDLGDAILDRLRSRLPKDVLKALR